MVTLREKVEWFVLCGSAVLIVVGLWYDSWLTVLFGATNCLWTFGIPYLTKRIENAIRRQK